MPKRTIAQIAEDYRIEVNGVRAWVPYWINEANVPRRPYRGKGTPRQIRRKLVEALGDRVISESEDLRELMHSLGLGVDCSGFAYYVLSQWLAEQGLSLSENLVVHRQEVLEAVKRHPERLAAMGGEKRLNELGATMPLAEACRLWHKDPRMITSVRRLTDPVTSQIIKQVGQILPGDMIKLTTQFGDHIGVVSEVSATEIHYVSSNYREGRPGGPEFLIIQLSDATKGLEDQDWAAREYFHPGTNQDGVWRLNVIDRGLNE